MQKGHFEWLHHLGTVAALTVVYFCLNVTSYGLSTFMPAIIKAQVGSTSQAASYLTTLPYLCAFCMMLVNGRHSDRSGERIWHVAVPLSCLTLAIGVAAVASNYSMLPMFVMLVFCCVGTFMYAHLPAFWPIPSIFLGSTAAASAIGFINMIGNLGGYVGPEIVGKAATSATGEEVNFSLSLWRIAPWPVVAATIIVTLGLARRKSFTAARTKSAQPGRVRAVIRPARAATRHAASSTRPAAPLRGPNAPDARRESLPRPAAARRLRAADTSRRPGSRPTASERRTARAARFPTRRSTCAAPVNNMK